MLLFISYPGDLAVCLRASGIELSAMKWLKFKSIGYLISMMIDSTIEQQKFLLKDETPLTRNQGSTEVFYKAPQYPISSESNLIVGGYTKITTANGGISFVGAENALSVVCAMDSINNGRAGFRISTILNYLAWDLNAQVPDLSVANTAANLLSYDLYFPGNSSSVKSGNISDIPINIGAIIGDGFFQDFYLVFPVFDGFRVPTLDFSTLIEGSLGTADYIPSLRNYKAIYRMTAAGSVSLGLAITDLCLYFNWSLVVPLFSDDFFGYDGQVNILAALNNANITDVCSQIISGLQPNSTNESIDQVVNCVNKNDARVIILYTRSDQGELAALQLQKRSKVGFLTFIFPYRTVDEPPTPAEEYQLFAGSLFFSPIVSRGYGPDDGYAQCFNNTTPQWLENNAPYLVKYWEAKFSCQVEGKNLTNCPETLSDRKLPCLCTGNESLRNINVTYRAAVAADTTDLMATAIYYMEQNCTYLTAMSLRRSPANPTDFCALTDFTPANLNEAISYVNFQGRSGFINFANGSSVRSIPNLTINQFFENETTELIGYYNTKLFLNPTKIYFPGGAVPTSEIIVDDPDLSDVIVDIFFAFAILGIVISLSITAFIIVYRDNRVIRKSSPLFCILILVGVGMVFLSLVFDSLSYSTTICFFATWLLVIGAGLIISNILAKTYRIYRIFTNPHAVALHISDWDLMSFTLIIFLGELILLSIYSFVGGLLQPIVFTSSSDPLYKYVECRVPSSAIQTTFTIILYVYNIFLIICAAVLAFFTRKVSSAFNESRYLAFIIYSYLLIALIILPLYYTTGDNADSALFRYIFRSIGIFLAMYVTMGALFIPKIQQALKYEQKLKRGRRNSGGTYGPGDDTAYGTTAVYGTTAYQRTAPGNGSS